MPFRSVRFDTDATRADRWSDALLDAGALSVDVSDPAAGTPGEAPVYGEPGGDAAPYWAVSRIEALFAATIDAEALVARTARDLGEPRPLVESREVADRDWVRATQAQFQPIRIDDDLWIVPTWCEPPFGSAVNITLDPGIAFGTGAHPSTRLCLAWLHHTVVPGRSVLDYGCGSGILAIAAAKLGAHPVTGVDIDPQAVSSSTANGRQNAVDATFVGVDALPAAAKFDLVVANILANPLRVLAPALSQRTAADGSIALAGILVAQAADVAAAYAPWFDIGVWRIEDDWALLAGRRRGHAAGTGP